MRNKLKEIIQACCSGGVVKSWSFMPGLIKAIMEWKDQEMQRGDRTEIENSVYSYIEEALKSYRLAYQFADEESSDNLCLVDVLTPNGDRDISRGQTEITYICENICDAVMMAIIKYNAGVVGETWKKAREQYKFDLTVTGERNKHLETKVKQLEQENDSLHYADRVHLDAKKGQEIRLGNKIQQLEQQIEEMKENPYVQLKESREVSVENVMDVIEGYIYRKWNCSNFNDDKCREVATAIHSLINGDKQ